MHNVRRLMNTLTHIDEISSSAHDPDILRVAAWYHGAFLNKALEIKLGGFQANFASTDASITRTTASPSLACPRRSLPASTS